MPAQENYKTKYIGVYFIIGQTIGTKRPEKIYYIRYRKNGRLIDEKAGRQFQDGMTPAKASYLRMERIQGAMTNKERREAEKIRKKKEEGRYTIDRLWSEYSLNRAQGKSLGTDQGRYQKYIEPVFGSKEPKELIKLDVDRVRLKLSKKLSPQTVKHVLNLLTWVINYGVKNNLCSGVSFHIQKPSVNNEKTEDLTPGQLKRLLQAMAEDENIPVANIMRMALYTGMRRGEIFNLQWKDINFDTCFIFIRNPKSGIDQKIPINSNAMDVLKSLHNDGGYVFPGRDGGKRTTIGKAGRRIRDRAGLPKDFRPMHGLRHVFASSLASSGKVGMYAIQKLMTHKSPKTTQRYAHLRDDTLKKASGQIDGIFEQLKSQG